MMIARSDIQFHERDFVVSFLVAVSARSANMAVKGLWSKSFSTVVSQAFETIVLGENMVGFVGSRT